MFLEQWTYAAVGNNLVQILLCLLQVLYLQAFVFVILMGKLVRKVFFGQLRAAEMEVGWESCRIIDKLSKTGSWKSLIYVICVFPTKNVWFKIGFFKCCLNYSSECLLLPCLQLVHFHFQHLIERSWYAVTETCLAFTVFRDDFSPRFVALFTLLLFLKCFHWLAEDRVDYVSNLSTYAHGTSIRTNSL